ncbi:hypothetical protein ABW19_dt0201021 [Dactylella cylindrospora]|nr:hypothetical protein ABW19_dt0201021 [Dactylella cylindrospora]
MDSSKPPTPPHIYQSLSKVSEPGSVPSPKEEVPFLVPEPAYQEQPKASLETLPLEILLQIAMGLPDVQTAVRLSCVSRSLHEKLGGSQYFWFKWGSQKLKKFQKFNKNYDYRKYILDAISGSIKSTCQCCLKPEVGVVRKTLGKVVCKDCLEDNIIPMTSVVKIRKINPARLPIIWTTVAYYPLTTLRRRNHFCWLPAVKREAEVAYKMPWNELVSKRLKSVKPLTSPRANSEYRVAVLERIRQQLLDMYLANLGNQLTYFIHLDTMKATMEAELQSTVTPKLRDMWAPTEGQTDKAIDGFVKKFTRSIFNTVVAKDISAIKSRRAITAPNPIWAAVRQGHMLRVASSGQFIGYCSICNGHTRYSVTEYVDHIQTQHPERILKTDWSWRP